MALSYRTRKRLALAILILGLPTYIVVAVTLVNMMERPSLLVELAIYVGLGVLWAVPLKPIFLGIAQADPAAKSDDEAGR